MYSFEQIHLQIMSHTAQRNIRCSACCSVRRLREAAHRPLQLHCTLLFPMFPGSSPSSLHPVPHKSILHLSTGPLHMTFSSPGLVLFMFLITPFSGKHSSTMRQIPYYVFSEVMLYAPSHWLLLLFYIYSMTI